MNDFFKDINLECDMIDSKYKVTKNGGYLDHQISYCDLLYIDGPEDETKFSRKKKYNTFSGKAAFSDALNYLENNYLPKLIIFDGRIDSVDLILNSKFSNYYKFYGSFRWALNHMNIYHLFSFNRHSIFRLKN